MALPRLTVPLRRLPQATALACALLAGGAVQADDGRAGPSWSFGGYGSIGLVHADTSQADFTSSILKPNGAGYTSRTSAKVDSRLGAQATVTLDRQWSAVLQMVVEQRMDDSFRPHVEWANINYQVTPDLSVRVGRIAVPMFLAADYRKVGYANTAVRMPVEIYNQVPVTSSDGIDLNYRWQTGQLKHHTQLFYGHHNASLLDGIHMTVNGIKGLSYSAEHGAATIRLSALTARLHINLGADLFAAYRQFGPAGAAVAGQYDTADKPIGAISIGASYDPGSWYVMSEAGRMNGHSLLGKTVSAYASAGYRAGDFTPYLSYARIRAGVPTTVAGLAPEAVPAPLAPTVAALNMGLNQYLSTIPVQSTIAAGLRWDGMDNAALKLQWERVRPSAGSRGSLINQQSAFRSGHSIHVVSAVVDFVF